MDTKPLRRKVLDLAIQGRLVPQDPSDEPAAVLLDLIRAEKAKLVKEGKLKKTALGNSVIYRGEDNKYYERSGKTVTCIDEQIPFEIPETWEWVRLKSIGEIITGSTPPKEQSKYYGGDIPFFKPTDLEQGKDVRESNDHLTQLGFDQSRKLPPNSVLVTCIGATIGKTGKLSVCGSCNQQINAIVPNSAVLPDFLYYTCNSSYMQNKIKSEASATTLPILNKNNFSILLLPLPPLAEQHRIVAKVEELLSVVERYEKAQDALDALCNSLDGRLRKSILSEAIQGRLVPQDPADEPASMLLQRIQAEKAKLVKEGKLKKSALSDSRIFRGEDNKYYEKVGKTITCIDEDIPFEIPQTWEWVRLGSVCTFLSRGKSPKYSETSKQYPVFAQKCNLKEGGISLSQARFLDPSTISKWDDVYKLRNGDVLVNSTGTGTVGRVRLFNEDCLGGYPFVVPDSHVSVVRTTDKIASEFVYAYLSSKHIQQYFEDNLAGSTNQKELYIGILEDLLLPLPPHLLSSSGLYRSWRRCLPCWTGWRASKFPVVVKVVLRLRHPVISRAMPGCI